MLRAALSRPFTCKYKKEACGNIRRRKREYIIKGGHVFIIGRYYEKNMKETLQLYYKNGGCGREYKAGVMKIKFFN